MSLRIAEGFGDESHARAFFEDSPVPIAYIDQVGKFLRCNSAWCRLVGYSAVELEARTFQSITVPDDVDADTNMAKRLLADPHDGGYSMVKKYLHKQGFTVAVTLHVRSVWSDDGHFCHFISWAVPLPNHGKFKLEHDEDTNEPYVRPVFDLKDFWHDNKPFILKFLGVAVPVLGWYSYQVIKVFNQMMEATGVSFESMPK